MSSAHRTEWWAVHDPDHTIGGGTVIPGYSGWCSHAGVRCGEGWARPPGGFGGQQSWGSLGSHTESGAIGSGVQL